MSEKVSTTETEKSPSSTSWDSPGGLDLNPRPPETVPISRKASITLVGVIVLLLALFAYGGWKRRQRQVAAYADANLPKRVAPATSAAADIENKVPAGYLPATGVRPAAASQSGQLKAPEEVPGYGQNPTLAARNTVPQPTPVYIRQAAAVAPVGLPCPSLTSQGPKSRDCKQLMRVNNELWRHLPALTPDSALWVAEEGAIPHTSLLRLKHCLPLPGLNPLRCQTKTIRPYRHRRRNSF